MIQDGIFLTDPSHFHHSHAFYSWILHNLCSCGSIAI